MTPFSCCRTSHDASSIELRDNLRHPISSPARSADRCHPYTFRRAPSPVSSLDLQLGFLKQSSQWRTVISNTFHDEYSWRKYGQKQIHSSKFPRSYFRCTHKYDQGCAATKQVQKPEDDPSVFVITYVGQHSCTSSHIMSNLIVASNSSAEPCIISFGSNASNVTQDFSLPSSSLFLKRQECDEEVLSSLRASTPSSDIFDLPSLCEGSLLGPVAMESALQHGGESSGLHSSTNSLDLRFMVDSLSFGDDLFCFDGDFFRD